MTTAALRMAQRAHARAVEARPRRVVRRYVTTTPDKDAAERIAAQHCPATVERWGDWWRVEALEEVVATP